MRAVNLLPNDSYRSKRKTPKPIVMIAVIGGAVLLAALGAGFVVTNGGLSKAEGELTTKQVELASMPKPVERPAPVPESAAFASEREPRVAAVAAALAQRVSVDRILRRFTLVLPDDVWLQSLQLTGPGGAEDPAAAGQGFAITGRTYTHDGVARLLSRMSALPDLENVQLQTSHLTGGDGPRLVEFTIVAAVRADGATT